MLLLYIACCELFVYRLWYSVQFVYATYIVVREIPRTVAVSFAFLPFWSTFFLHYLYCGSNKVVKIEIDELKRN